MRNGKIVITKKVLDEARTTKKEYIIDYNDTLYTIRKRDIESFKEALYNGTILELLLSYVYIY